ncbi:MAG: RtcB family protein [Candidatus Marinimicrobia bacterium]|nr:RtcB family protein [Candidatus Neomarinimicrobiota bacterium]MCF7828636.1 RtcB family protein [Candidatus Neomarinimicrobiota bacterium]MCF7880377.1 RtcB family protein [Candidatus Neomarinimicrobiota bacterium]
MAVDIRQIDEHTWEIPKTGNMRVPGRVYASEKLMQDIRNDQSLQQVQNVAHLPGIARYSLAMPDIHWGYGFPIGGVCATDAEDGVVSPGGVGYDINCGVRLISTKLQLEDIQDRIRNVVTQLYNNVPTGVGSSGAIRKVSKENFKKLITRGAEWAVSEGFGHKEDLEFIEEDGCLEAADPGAVSDRAFERGKTQVGTLGSGNHFLEIGKVDEIYHPQAASLFGLRKDSIVVIIHTGSRGFGHQICDDHLKTTINATHKYNIDIPDKQLACAPIKSDAGQRYLGAMRCGANFAFNNRQVIMHLAEQSFMDALNITPRDLGFNLVYDICHNIAKFEDHGTNGHSEKLCVHRKGATRAFGPGSTNVPRKYTDIGQPVLVPGDMGRYSYVCVGTSKAMEDTFGSSCHGAGRQMSRRQSKKQSRGKDIYQELRDRGVEIQAAGNRTVAEEMPHAYKDVADVVEVMHNAGITSKVARFRPIGVIKG